MEPSETRVTANGLEFGLLEMGSGPLALCLHGFPDSPFTWRHLLPALADAGFRAVAPHMRGYAPTAVPADAHYYPAALASDACALHEALGGDGDAVVIGHDWGAAAVWGAAADADRWRRLVAMSVPHLGSLAGLLGSYGQLKRSFYIWFFQLPIAEGVVGADDLAFIDGLWGDWVGAGYDATEDVAHVKACLRQPENLAAAIGYYRDTFGFKPPAPEHERFVAASAAPTPKPTLYLHGTADNALGIDLVQGLDQFLADGSEVDRFEGLNHFLHLEDPGAVNKRIVEFVSGR
ncbi:MAG: alpha/beta hydrolase [Acidimicrobiia bacterium]|nr:alpha/beta hydrolase [Acidimicrobiia bacterium]